MTTLPKFLLADDDMDDASLFCEALHLVDSGATCQVAENGKQVFDILMTASETPQFIFLDLNMPIMNGWECLENLKKDGRFNDVPVVMYSTSSNEQDRKKAFSLGAFCFITKPDQFRSLKNILAIFTKCSMEDLAKEFKGDRNVSFKSS